MLRVRVGDVLRLERVLIDPDPAVEYVSIGIRSFGKGIFHYDPKPGDQLGSLRFFEVQANRLVLSNIKGWEGAIAVSSDTDAGCISSNRFLSYAPIGDQIYTRWALWYFLSDPGLELIQRASPGSADRNRTLAIDRFEDLEIPLPPIDDQRRVADRLDRLWFASTQLQQRSEYASKLSSALAVSVSSRPDLDGEAKIRAGWLRVALGDVFTLSRAFVQVQPSHRYPIAGIYSFGRGLIDRGVISGADTSYKSLTLLSEDDIALSKLNGWEGAVAVVDRNFEGYHVSSEYPIFKVDQGKLLPAFFSGIARSPSFWEDLNSNARGSTVGRRRISAAESPDDSDLAAAARCPAPRGWMLEDHRTGRDDSRPQSCPGRSFRPICPQPSIRCA